MQGSYLFHQMVSQPRHLLALLALHGVTQLIKIMLGFIEIIFYQRTACTKQLPVKAWFQRRMLQ
ncbi:hypothetical protein D3C71_2108250 [compost metagenome]